MLTKTLYGVYYNKISVMKNVKKMKSVRILRKEKF